MKLTSKSNCYNRKVSILSPVSYLNINLLNKYLQLRHKIFVKELGRTLLGEFTIDDFIARHYVLEIENIAIGVARVLSREKHIAEIGRVAILAEYRNQGYGTLLVNKIIDEIKASLNVRVIRLFAEDEKISFYKNLGFIESNRSCFSDVYLTDMIKYNREIK